eukprot:Nk52_evm19s153 gene=Nk52_evmTU19s153
MYLSSKSLLFFVLSGLVAIASVLAAPQNEGAVNVGSSSCSTVLTAQNYTFYNPSNTQAVLTNLEMYLNSTGSTFVQGDCGNMDNTTIISKVAQTSDSIQPYQVEMNVFKTATPSQTYPISDLIMKTSDCGETCYVNNKVFTGSNGNVSISMSASNSEFIWHNFYSMSSHMIAKSTGKGNKFNLGQTSLNSLTAEGFKEVVLDQVKVPIAASIAVATDEDNSSVSCGKVTLSQIEGFISTVKQTGRNTSTNMAITTLENKRCYRILYTDGANTKVTINGIQQTVSVGAGEVKDSNCTLPFLEIEIVSGTVDLYYEQSTFPDPSTESCLYPTLENLSNLSPNAIPPCSAAASNLPSLTADTDINELTGKQTPKGKGDPNSASSAQGASSLVMLCVSLCISYIGTMML